MAYLTDVYILKEYQGKGLGTWLMKCLDETISQWPALRRLLVLTSDSESFYKKWLKVKPFEPGEHGLKILNRFGGGSRWQD
jgi:GNAT superfamily N-acetyltransferase